MEEMKQNVVLFANTGMGNSVLKELVKSEFINVVSVCTQKFEGVFPHFEEEELYTLCDNLGVSCFCNRDVNVDMVDLLKSEDLDYIIVASFGQILKEKLISLPKKGVINFHPSLLPAYRGPTPIIWAILNDEVNTGVTVHWLTKVIDGGEVILQSQIEIETKSLGELFQQLADLCGELTRKLILMITSNCDIISKKQNENNSSYFTKPLLIDRIINLSESIEMIIKRVRAFSPSPMPKVFLLGNEFNVEGYEILKNIQKQEFIDYNAQKNQLILGSCNTIIKLKLLNI